jgi:hypothetical protein
VSEKTRHDPDDPDASADAPGTAPDADQAAAQAAAKRAKSEKIGRYVAMFVMPLLMVGMMVWGYMGALHSRARTPDGGHGDLIQDTSRSLPELRAS